MLEALSLDILDSPLSRMTPSTILTLLANPSDVIPRCPSSRHSEDLGGDAVPRPNRPEPQMNPLDQQTPRRILVTGSCGLIGSTLIHALIETGFTPVELDLRGHDSCHGDIRVPADVQAAVADCIGVIHLAAISRVIDGEKDPDACWTTNVEGTRNVVQAANALPNKPWFIYASSREVYGEPRSNPVSEDSPLVPVNIYGRSKIAAEALVTEADLHTAIVRFSDVYGTTTDHADRVIPAFARQAALGLPLRVDGRGHTFDFTHLEDTVRGVLAVVDKLEAGGTLPPIHFVTGQPTTLGELADLAVSLAGSSSSIHEAPPRTYDVTGFYGDPTRAERLLSWRATVPLAQGLERLIQDFRAVNAAEAMQ